MDISGKPSATLLGGLTGVAVVGAADVALFIAMQPSVALKTPGRAAGSLAGLAIWLGLSAVAARRWRGPETQALATATLALAGLAALDGIGLAAVHAAAHVGGVRSLLGGAAGAVALALAVGARR